MPPPERLESIRQSRDNFATLIEATLASMLEDGVGYRLPDLAEEEIAKVVRSHGGEVIDVVWESSTVVSTILRARVPTWIEVSVDLNAL